MSISVLTRGYNNGRDGANPQEGVLTAAAVRPPASGGYSLCHCREIAAVPKRNP